MCLVLAAGLIWRHREHVLWTRVKYDCAGIEEASALFRPVWNMTMTLHLFSYLFIGLTNKRVNYGQFVLWLSFTFIGLLHWPKLMDVKAAQKRVIFFFSFFFLSWVILFYELSNNSNVVVSQLECNVNLNQSLFARIKSLHYYSFITTIIYILPFSWFPSRFKGLVIITLHPDHVKVFVDTWLCFYWVMSLCFGMRVKWSNI